MLGGNKNSGKIMYDLLLPPGVKRGSMKSLFFVCNVPNFY